MHLSNIPAGTTTIYMSGYGSLGERHLFQTGLNLDWSQWRTLLYQRYDKILTCIALKDMNHCLIFVVLFCTVATNNRRSFGTNYETSVIISQKTSTTKHRKHLRIYIIPMKCTANHILRTKASQGPCHVRFRS